MGKKNTKTATPPKRRRHYWLLKTEPNEWSWSDQVAALDGVEKWDGVRNHQAVKHLKSMSAGDLCFFYHSGSGAGSRRVVGVVEVVKTWYEEAGGGGGGGAVDVRAVGPMQRPVALGEIKKEAAGGEGMEEFGLIRQPRLSVVPVPESVWDKICEMGGGFAKKDDEEEEEEH